MEKIVHSSFSCDVMLDLRGTKFLKVEAKNIFPSSRNAKLKNLSLIMTS